MIKTDQNKKSRKNRSNQSRNDQSYPDIGHAKDIALSQSNNSQSNADLKNELAEIKTMLSAAKKDLVKYKCPLQEAPTASTQAPKKPLHPKAKPKKEIVHDEVAQEAYHDGSAASSHEEVENPAAHQAPAPSPVAPRQVAPAQVNVPASAPSNAPANVTPQNVPVQAPAAAPANATTHPHDDEIVDELPSTAPPAPSVPVPAPPASHTMINLAPAR